MVKVSEKYYYALTLQCSQKHTSILCTYLSVGTGPLSSIGSPITLMILPRVAGPTGIEMGLPVSMQTLPRTRPSVPSIAIVLTVFSPVVINGRAN